MPAELVSMIPSLLRAREYLTSSPIGRSLGLGDTLLASPHRAAEYVPYLYNTTIPAAVAQIGSAALAYSGYYPAAKAVGALPWLLSGMRSASFARRSSPVRMSKYAYPNTRSLSSARYTYPLRIRRFYRRTRPFGKTRTFFRGGRSLKRGYLRSPRYARSRYTRF